MLWATLRDTWKAGPLEAVPPRSKCMVVDALLFFPCDRLDVDSDFQIDDSHWLLKTFCCCGRAGATLGILRGKQHPAAVQLPRVF